MTKKSLACSVAVLVAVLALPLLIDTDWEVSRETTIDAQPEAVWRWMADLDSYPKWNRYSRRVDGILAEGEVVLVEAHLDDEVQLVENRILSVIPERELCWQSLGKLAYGTRCRRLEQTDDGSTRLVHHEIMQGPLAGLIKWIYLERIERGLEMVNASLAQQAESGQPQG
jgi:uncharacterized protein YndB with AHSA1/START domain